MLIEATQLPLIFPIEGPTTEIYSDKELCAVCGCVMGYDGSVNDSTLGRITCCMECYTSGRLKTWRDLLEEDATQKEIH